MARERGDRKCTMKLKPTGMQEVYFLVADTNDNPILDGNDNVQVVEGVADNKGRQKTVTKLEGGSVVDGTKEVVTPGTPVPLHAGYPCRSVLVVAKTTNTNTVFIGDGTPVMPFSAGKGVSLAVDNLNRVSIDATVAGEGVYWLAEV